MESTTSLVITIALGIVWDIDAESGVQLPIDIVVFIVIIIGIIERP